ncbi:MAG: hypothetical protein ACWA5A_13605 [Marinibacterium sp.]
MSDQAPNTYKAREVAGIFHDVEALEKAVEEATNRGFPEGDFSIMAIHGTVSEKFENIYHTVEDIEDDPRIPRKIFIPRPERRVGEAAVVGAPMFALGMAGALGVLATGGAAGLAIAVAAASGAAGAGVGGLLARAIEKHHADVLAKSLTEGGTLLWVSTPDDEREKLAIEILESAGASHVHAHEIERTWGPDDRPLADFNPDPFLESDPK